MPHTRRHPNPLARTESLLLSDRLSELRLSSGSSQPRTRNRYNAPDEARRPLLESEEVAVTLPEDRSTGSLFTTGTTTTTTATTSTTAGREEEEVVGGGRRRRNEENWAQRTRESYYLQMTLAARVSSQATLADDRSGPDVCGVSPDPATVSYRFWV